MKKIVFYLQILAMVFFAMSGAFIGGLPTAQAIGPTVLINEFQLGGTQWVEIMNATANDINLASSTWQLVSTVMGPGSATTTLSSGIIPAYGLLTFTVSGLPTGASTLLSLNNNGSLIYAMSYGDSAFGAEPHLAGYPTSTQSAVLTGGTTWSATSTITRGWYNEGPAPTIAAIVTMINAGGVVTNMDTLTDPSAATDLYFEKRTDISSSTTALGKMTFAGPLNLTNASTTDILQNLGTEMDAAAGAMSFDARTATDLKDAGAEITIYGLDDLGYAAAPEITVKDDDGNPIATTSPDYPALTGITYDSGDLTFSAEHFTGFETGPTLAVVTPIPETTNNNNPSFTFSSDVAAGGPTGPIGSSVALTGSCGDFSDYALGNSGVNVGNNTITYDYSGGMPSTLSDGTYSDCTVVVTDAGGHSSTLNVPAFTVDASAPSLSSGLGNGTTDYSLSPTFWSTASDRGDFYGAVLVFSEELSSASKSAVEAAITAGASSAPRLYVWASDRVRIYATGPVYFDNDVVASISDPAGNTTTDVTLIDSLDDDQSVVYVDDDYYDGGGNDGHTWGVDAFSSIQAGVDVAEANGTVNILPGNYDEIININKPLTLEGDVGDEAAGPGPDAPAITYSSCDRTINLDGNNITIEGMIISGDCSYPNIRVANGVSGAKIFDNELINNWSGVGLSPFSSGTTIRRNDIHNNYQGIMIGGSQNNTISDNSIHDNYYYGIEFKCGASNNFCESGGTVISNNNITTNTNAGIYFHAGDQSSPVTIGPDNIITGNSDGIYVSGDSYNLFINGNQIYNNIAITSGLHVENDTTGLDATENWWGDATGPEETNGNPDGLGDVITLIDSFYINYRPFCTDADCAAFSGVTVTVDNLSTLFNNGGTITPVLNGDVATSTAAVTSLDVNEDTTIAVPSGDGTSTVVLPAGTVITKTDGGTFDASDLTAADVALSGISGFAAGIVVEGAFQWGIPDLGLTFSPAITLNIYVGTDLNGQALTIYRSLSQTSGWVTSGIVAPGTCVVTAGICTFQTTKASYFATTKGTATSGNSGGVLLSYQLALNNQTTTSAATYAYPVSPDHNFIKVKGLSAVYWLSPEGKRYLFASRAVFSSWFGDDFSGLREISQSEFDGIAFGGNLTVKPGSYLKFDNSATVYLVKDNYSIYPSTGTAGYLIQAGFESNYNINGLVINRSSIYSQINSGFIKATGQSGVYWLSSDNKRYLFANRETFSSWFGNDFSGLKNISQTEFDGIASGGNLTVKPGSYLKFDNSDIEYYVKDANNICKTTISTTAKVYQIQASFEADYNVTGNCQ